MSRISFAVLLVAVVAGLSCAKFTPDPPEPRHDPTADPIDGLVADAAVAARFGLEDPDELQEVLRASLPGGGGDIRSPEEFFGGPALARLLEDPGRFDGLDAERPLYFAVTPRGNRQFVNALELSRVLPLEEDPKWLHSRIVIDAREGEADELRRQVEPIFESGSEEVRHWRVWTRGDRVVADRLTMLNPAVDVSAESGFDQLGGRAGLGRRKNSSARAKFARSEAPVAVYGDVRRIGLVLAIERAGTRAARFAADFGGKGQAGRLPLLSRWGEDNDIAADLFRKLHRRQGDYSDWAVELSAETDELRGRGVATRTREAAERAEASQSGEFEIAEHPGDDPVVRLEATAQSEQGRVHRRIVEWLDEGDSPARADGALQRYRELSPWRLFQYPGKVLSAAVVGAGATPPVRSLRYTVYEPGAFGEATDERQQGHPVVVTAAFEPTDGAAERIERALERRLGERFDWELDPDLRLRAARHVELDEVFGDETATSSPDPLSIRADGPRARAWLEGADSAGGRIGPVEVFGLVDGDGDWSLEAQSEPTHTRFRFGPTGRERASVEALPRQAVAVEDVHPQCALNARQAIGRLVEEFRSSPRTAPDRGQRLARRAIPIIDRARHCEQEYPQLPRFSRVLGRQVWYLGIRHEYGGRIDAAREMYGQGCDFEEPVACRYLRRIRRAAAVEPPETDLRIRPGWSASRFSGLVRGYVTVDEFNRVSVENRSVGTLRELSEKRVRGRLDERLEAQPLPTPLALVAADERLVEQARRRVGLVAPPHRGARTVLRSMTADPLSDTPAFMTYLQVPGDEEGEAGLRVTLLEIERVEQLPSSPAELKGQTRLRIGDDGIDVFAEGRRLRPTAGCPGDGPTVCRRLAGPRSDRAVPVRGLLEVMPRISTWRQGRGDVVIELDTDVAWGSLVEIAALVADPNHRAWRRPGSDWVSWFTPRFGVPFTEVRVAVPEG